MLKAIFRYLGVSETAVEATVQSFVRATWYSAPAFLSMILLQMTSDGATTDPQLIVPWLAHNLWRYFIAFWIAPFLHAHGVNNLYTTHLPSAHAPVTSTVLDYSIVPVVVMPRKLAYTKEEMDAARQSAPRQQ